MFIPEYTITNNILKNISIAEHGKAIVETTTILPRWQRQLEKEARLKLLDSLLKLLNIRIPPEKLKKSLDSLTEDVSVEIENLLETMELLEELIEVSSFEEETVRNLHKTTFKNTLPKTKVGVYRNAENAGKTSPEEILAQMAELADWYNSLDAKETHPILKAGILKAQLEYIMPFEVGSTAAATWATLFSLGADAYRINEYICLEDYFLRSGAIYNRALLSVEAQEGDFTEWLEYYTEAFVTEVSNIKEKIILLAKDTKVAKASGQARLTPRQEKLVVYLQDYGMLQNRNFVQLFPHVSEDSVLRDLKRLVDMGVVVKRGSTKASRYELR